MEYEHFVQLYKEPAETGRCRMETYGYVRRTVNDNYRTCFFFVLCERLGMAPIYAKHLVPGL